MIVTHSDYGAVEMCRINQTRRINGEALSVPVDEFPRVGTS
jgi:hypothetical protein